LNIDELKAILQMTEDGTEEIISTRSKVFQKLNMDLDELSLKELLDLVRDNPGLLRRPIMIDEKRLQVGFNEDEIRRFLPRDVRQYELRQAQLMAVKCMVFNFLPISQRKWKPMGVCIL
jgi:regulatory protein spx